MNNAQVRHTLAMTRKIQTHLDSMNRVNRAISQSVQNPDGLPVHLIIENFGEFERWYREIESVIDDMLPELEHQ